ncbi:MAG: MBL fold metallo-hydrolase, partial [Candidatus ainarchaeum sp.]|nr:MBL fold metallo-hydrolase [Candidatus ainarchaeum sp.]
MFREILPNLFFFDGQGAGSNVFLLAGKKTALVDSSSESNSAQLISSLEKTGFSRNEIDFVFHTHGHADHFGCDFLFPNARIRMHKFDANFVNSPNLKFTAANLIPTSHFPRITSFFRQDEVIDLGCFKLQVLFTPGHTKGSVCFFGKKQGLLFSGDTLFNGSFGRFDLQSGNPSNLCFSLKKILNLEF